MRLLRGRHINMLSTVVRVVRLRHAHLDEDAGLLFLPARVNLYGLDG